MTERKLGKVSELVYLGFGADLVEYRTGWDLQRRVHARRVADEVPDSCLLLEHEPVYTGGKRTAVSDRPLGDPGRRSSTWTAAARSPGMVPGS